MKYYRFANLLSLKKEIGSQLIVFQEIFISKIKPKSTCC